MGRCIGKRHHRSGGRLRRTPALDRPRRGSQLASQFALTHTEWPMKKLASSKTPIRKLTLRTETIGILRQLSSHELRHTQIVGASTQDCRGSTDTDRSQFLET